MVINTPRYRNRTVEEIGLDYEKEGYDVVFSPSDNALPPFLQGFHPDLIATKPDDSVVVEVKSPSKVRPGDYVSEISKIVRQQPGWSLRIVVSNEPSEPDSVSLEEIDSLLVQSEQLEKEDRFTASLLTAWPAIEAAMRWSVEKYKIDVPDFGARTLIARLYSDGDLERDEYGLLERYVKAHYMAGHGYRENIEPGELERLRAIARRLLTE